MLFDFGAFGQSTATTAASNIINFGTTQFGNALNAKRNYKYARKLQDAQNQYNYKMWQENNAYNAPSAQVERLRDAGINPMLAVTNGQLQNASQGQVQASQGSLNLDQGNVAPADYASNYLNTLSTNAEVDYYAKMAKNLAADTTSKDIANQVRLATAIEEIKGRKGNYKGLEEQAKILEEQAKQSALQTSYQRETYDNMIEMSNIGVEKANVERDIAKQQWSQQEKRFGLEIADTLASIKLKVAQRQMSLQQGRAALINAIANSDTAKSLVRYNNAKSTYQEGVNASAKSHGYVYETGKLQTILADKNNEAAMDRLIMSGQLDALGQLYDAIRDYTGIGKFMPDRFRSPEFSSPSNGLPNGTSHPSRALPKKKSKFRFRKR